MARGLPEVTCLGHSCNTEGSKEKGGEMSKQGCWEPEECGAERGWESRKDGGKRADGEVNHSWRLLHMVLCVW